MPTISKQYILIHIYKSNDYFWDVIFNLELYENIYILAHTIFQKIHFNSLFYNTLK